MNLTNSGIIALVTGCTHLRRLGIKSFYLTDTAVLSIGYNCPLIEVLALHSPNSLTDASFRTIGNALTCLRTLRTDVSCHVSTEGLLSAVQRCRLLTTLVLTGRSYISDHLVTTIAPHLPSLTALGLPQAQFITDFTIWAVGTNCPHLRKLDIGGCTGLTEAALHLIAQCSKQLQVLHMWTGSNYVTDTALRALALNRSLTEVDLSFVEFCETFTADGIACLLEHCPIKYLILDQELEYSVPKKARPPMGQCDMDRCE